MFSLKPFLGFGLLPFWFLSISHDVFSQDNIDGSSVLPLMFFSTNSMNGSLRNISGFLFITIFGIQAYHIMLFINTLMV